MDTRSKIFLSLIAILFTSTLYLLYLNFNKTPAANTLIPQTGVVPTSESTATWQIYSNNELSFKYPSGWAINKNLTGIIGSNPDVAIGVVSKDLTLMNECMKLITTENKTGFVIKKFSRVTIGEMCSTEDSTPREIWVIPTAEDYSPGISYIYSSTDSLKAESIFGQILSTFKFTVTPSAKLTPTTTSMVDTGPLKTILASINSQLKTAYKEVTLDNGKTWSVDLTKLSYDKTNMLIVKKAITDFGLVFDPSQSGEAVDSVEVYVKNADTCSLRSIKSVLTLSCYN